MPSFQGFATFDLFLVFFLENRFVAKRRPFADDMPPFQGFVTFDLFLGHLFFRNKIDLLRKVSSMA